MPGFGGRNQAQILEGAQGHFLGGRKHAVGIRQAVLQSTLLARPFTGGIHHLRERFGNPLPIRSQVSQVQAHGLGQQAALGFFLEGVQAGIVADGARGGQDVAWLHADINHAPDDALADERIFGGHQHQPAREAGGLLAQVCPRASARGAVAHRAHHIMGLFVNQDRISTAGELGREVIDDQRHVFCLEHRPFNGRHG